ncbi:peroxin 19 [Trypanosoma conorhini]|uniref:Peroxin 19 n=1 Tax=Trypanosoma conorhini TaxID=83891 RepID=A0A3S5IQV5_9TRYP|nr:peroxin 19 [Trypanosoma conorhini]RNF02620.1 peroxin 19 [Trypanosoma conorhini]
MTHPRDDDDLDALLDDCINTMDEQERRHEAEVKARDAAREAELEKHLAESGSGAEVMRLLQSFMNDESAEGNADPSSLMNKLQGEITQVSSLLNDLPDVSEEERASVKQLQELFDRLAAMSTKDEDDAAGGDDAGNEVLAEALKKCMEGVEALTGSETNNAAASVAVEKAPSPEAPTGAAGAADADDAIAAGLSGILLECLLDPGLLRVMRLMQRAYPRWLAANEGNTSAEDLERYNKQFKLVNSICDLIGDASVDPRDAAKTNQLVFLAHEFASLGSLPPELEKVMPEEEEEEQQQQQQQLPE